MRLFAFAFIASVQALRLPPRLVLRRGRSSRPRCSLRPRRPRHPRRRQKKTRAPAIGGVRPVNLVKSIVGAGVLALPAGVAAFSDAGPALWPATALITALGAASACSFERARRGVRRPTALTPRRTRTPRARSVGEKSAWVVTLCCTLTPFGVPGVQHHHGRRRRVAHRGGEPGAQVCSALKCVRRRAARAIAALTLGALWPLCSLVARGARAHVGARHGCGGVHGGLHGQEHWTARTRPARPSSRASLSDFAPKFGSTS